MNVRIGHGYDAHRFIEGRPLILGGVHVPHDTGLDGHSDADVLLHAIMDAMLGAAALGDIGKHFPDTDERYKGADSLELLKHTANLLFEKGYALQNVDATVIAQAPKLAPYIEEMRVAIAGAVLAPVSSVSVKATTTEHMGFEGRGEGISCHAVCLLKNFNTPST
ncbi:MAG: 2-C-methyl-D-erythritol 2,4-cyclodiphosphate synthase [Ruminococcaceae bacterium]|nr:2-C-methyl-D-erythritol 2,4-cyclodiphosphate synthase [Oscillospiraceae bacterium]